MFKTLGCIQYDVLDVVGRNTDLVLQSRVQGYRRSMLYDLLYKDRHLIDGWDKEMSVYPMGDWPSFKRIRQRQKNDAQGTLRYRGQEEALSALKEIKQAIKKQGPLAARELKLGPTEANSWGHRQVSGAAMDYLYQAGELGVHSKKNAQKTYDLIERLYPKKIREAPDPFKSDAEFFEWYFLRRIKGLGAAWLRGGGGWLGYYLGNMDLRKQICNDLVEKKLILPLEVPELKETFYIPAKGKALLNKKPNYDETARFIAPLDNLIWDRGMIKRVFNFEYTWEVYTPQEKRKYGYYVLPILYKNSFIGRCEPARPEKGKPLEIKSWWWEEKTQNAGAAEKKGMTSALRRGLEVFADYLEVPKPKNCTFGI